MATTRRTARKKARTVRKTGRKGRALLARQDAKQHALPVSQHAPARKTGRKVARTARKTDGR